MRHRVKKGKLSRPADHRRAMLRNQVRSLFLNGSIVTTRAKARQTRARAERMITLATNDTVHARRRARAFLLDTKVTTKLFREIAPAFVGRAGGYTRVYRLGARRGDGAEVALLKLLVEEKEEEGE